VGLACGGTIEVFVERLDVGAYEAARRWIESGTGGALLTVVAGPDDQLGAKAIVERGQIVAGSLTTLDSATLTLAETARAAQRVTTTGGLELLIDPFRPALALVIVGGAHIAVALARLARVLGYRTVVIDPRRAFGSAARFPEVDRLVQAWPEKALAEEPLTAESAVVTLSHDPKIDDPALRLALDSDAFYVGALGSHKTHAARRDRLAAMGFSDAQLARIHAPIGLDIGADNPEEIALAIMAEVVRAWRGSKQ
jgi:xanthine dehydrogenase accessory factor